MDDRQKFIETSLPEKEGFMEDIADVNYTHGKIVCKDFLKKKLGEYHYLYVQSNALLLADVLENFQIICLEI